jgi:1-deoxy-D-xylulose-5-phosphate synthase
MSAVLDRIQSPADLRTLSLPELTVLAGEIRERIIEVVSANGGHLAPSLGTVELTLALHSIFDTPRDQIVWDVGHQCYGHKLVTGRKERFHTIRQFGGIAGFPSIFESEYDTFGTGHASTAISAALGLATARDLRGERHEVVAVVGDGGLTGGLSFEGMNQAGVLGVDLLVIVNDNKMSISPNVGALSRHLTGLMSAPSYRRFEEDVYELLGKLPFGHQAQSLAGRIKESLKTLIIPGTFFESLGFKYFGPIDGHDLPALMKFLSHVKEFRGPRVLHVQTVKGKGYRPAEGDATTYHGLGSFDKTTGAQKPSKGAPAYTKVFGDQIVAEVRRDPRVIGITAAMTDGAGLKRLSREFPERFMDVGIAEEHAVCYAAGLARGGMKPVVAIYSTFLQRAYDQIVHDVTVQKLPVVFAIDRAGLVGEDGAGFHGVFDIAYLRCLPGFVLMAPKDEAELQRMLVTAVRHEEGPIALRYPRAAGLGVPLHETPEPMTIGEAEVLREGDDVTLLALGSMVEPSLRAAEILAGRGLSAGVVNGRFVKPLDAGMLRRAAARTRRLVSVEEHSVLGGWGSALLEFYAEAGVDVSLLRLGVPDAFSTHGARNVLLREAGLDAEGIAADVAAFLGVEAEAGLGGYQAAR